jgi:hypothetical protein
MLIIVIILEPLNTGENIKKNKQAEYRANYTEEKHQEVLLKKKEVYDNE